MLFPMSKLLKNRKCLNFLMFLQGESELDTLLSNLISQNSTAPTQLNYSSGLFLFLVLVVARSSFILHRSIFLYLLNGIEKQINN